MSASIYTVSIFFDSQDAADENFANVLAKQIESITIPALKDITDFVSYNRTWWRRRRGYPGIPIFILSESILSTPENRQALSNWVRFTHRREYHHYYICRGIEPALLYARYPDLTPIFQEVMVLKEQERMTLLDDLRDYVTHVYPQTRLTHRSTSVQGLIRLLIAFILTAVSQPMEILYYLCFGVTIVIYILWLTSSQSSWELVFAATCFYGIGYRLNKIFPLDLWPWLGPRWHMEQIDLAQLAIREYHSTVIKARILDLFLLILWGLAIAWFRNWIPLTIAFVLINILRRIRFRKYTQALIRIANSPQPQTEFDRADIDSITGSGQTLQLCLNEWMGARWANFAGSIFLFTVLITAGLMALDSLTTMTLVLGLVAFTIGVLVRPIAAWAQKIVAIESAVEAGLSKWMLEREERIHSKFLIPKWFGDSDFSQEMLSSFEEIERSRAIRWIGASMAPLSWLTRRWWLTRRDYIFISYAWADDLEVGLSRVLAQQLEDLKFSFFLDKRDVQNKFLSWRETLAPALEKCTHILLVVSANITQGTVVQLELNTALQRWHYEMLPAIICVVDPEVARALCQDHRVPFNLRFVLTWCPKLTFTQARNPQLVAALLQQRRRQGLLRDWLKVLSRRFGILQNLNNFDSINRALAIDSITLSMDSTEQ